MAAKPRPQVRRKAAPGGAADINTEGGLFSGMSWVMGIICLPLSAFYLYLFVGIRATAAVLLLSLCYLLAANLMIPPIRRFWIRATGFQLYGRRLVYIYLALFLLIMGLGYFADLMQESRSLPGYAQPDEQASSAPITPMDTLLAPAKRGLFWGYVNADGQWIIPARSYTRAEPFYQGVARVWQGPEAQYINWRNEPVVHTGSYPARVEAPAGFPYQPADSLGLWGWKDAQGTWRHPPQYDAVGHWGYTTQVQARNAATPPRP